MSSQATKERAKLKKEYIKKTIASGDPRSYNEIQADLELMLWKEKYESIFSVESALELPAEPAPVAEAPIEQPAE